MAFKTYRKRKIFTKKQADLRKAKLDQTSHRFAISLLAR